MQAPCALRELPQDIIIIIALTHGSSEIDGGGTMENGQVPLEHPKALEKAILNEFVKTSITYPA